MEVKGRVHFLMIVGFPLAVCVMATITRLAPVTRSIAPPHAETIQLISRSLLPDSRLEFCPALAYSVYYDTVHHDKVQPKPTLVNLIPPGGFSNIASPKQSKKPGRSGDCPGGRSDARIGRRQRFELVAYRERRGSGSLYCASHSPCA